jgi:hypothetical protein
LTAIVRLVVLTVEKSLDAADVSRGFLRLYMLSHLSACITAIYQQFGNLNRSQSQSFYGLCAVIADEARQNRAKPLAASEGEVDRHSILRTVEQTILPCRRKSRSGG